MRIMGRRDVGGDRVAYRFSDHVVRPGLFGGGVGVIAEFKVVGDPIPQGSMKGFYVNGRVVLTSDNPRLKAWRGLVAVHAPTLMVEGAVKVIVLFALPRPKTVKRLLPIVKPDADKLARAILDSLTGTVFKDDSQVTDLDVRKRYAVPGEEPGVVIRVEEVTA